MRSFVLACQHYRPELSRIHEGIALRDEAWERVTTFNLMWSTSVKRLTSKLGSPDPRTPSRWVDKGMWRLLSPMCRTANWQERWRLHLKGRFLTAPTGETC